MWSKINWVVRPPHPGALMRVEREINGQIVEFTEEEPLIENILDVIQDRFSGAENANISNCSITSELGDYGFTDLGLQILSGQFQPPDDMNSATARLLQTISDIGQQHKDDNINIDVTPSEFISGWQRARESTSSSRSGIHFGHYISATTSKIISTGLAMQISLIARSGSPPQRWKNVLMVMLEKKMGVVLIPKLRAILLKEADNNFHDGEMFGGRMLEHVRSIGFIPQEQLAERGNTAEDGVWIKVLKADYSRLCRKALSITSADAANCYDRVNHIVLGLLLLALGMPMGPIVSMLLTIRLMRYYLRTGFGESTQYMGGESARRKMHGLNQGSRAAAQCWLIVCSVLVNMQRARGHVATVITPITKLISTLVGSMYVDDSDLFTLDASINTDEELWLRTQSSLTDWGHSLLASGGGCKAVKCWSYMINYDWDENGNWYCYSIVDGFDLTIPTDDGIEKIDLLEAHEGKETLGVFTAPDGNSKDHFKKLLDKVKTWTSRIAVGHLPARFAWKSYTYQLWMSIRYGIGALPADSDEVEGFLQPQNRDMLPYLGVNRNIRTGWRCLHRSFLGIGLFNFEIELLIQRVNMFLQHFDSPYDLGITLRATLELVQLEAGLTECPLLCPFYPVGEYVTHCWVRSFWRALDKFGLKLHLDYPVIKTPRERDHSLLHLYRTSPFDPTFRLFKSWNKCRIACRAIFLSCITAPDGKYIDWRYLDYSVITHPPPSEYNFAREQPSEEDWQVWLDFWDNFTYPGFVLPTSLGPWTHHSHRPCEWFFCSATDDLINCTKGETILYTKTKTSGRLRSQQQFSILGRLHACPDLTDFLPCAIEPIDSSSVIFRGVGPPRYDPTTPPLDLIGLLRSWGGEWMWEYFEVVGNFSAIISAIQDGSALWCTDGSFDRSIMPNISSSGWIIFDPATKSHIKGSFYEISPFAGSYRGELLGLTALHLVAFAIQILFGQPSSPCTICCDNERALAKASLFRRRIPPASKHGDLLRLLRNLSYGLGNFFSYKHIYGHADRNRLWIHLTLLEKLNCICDKLAERSRLKSGDTTRDISLQKLPRETAALFINRVKQTGDISDELRFQLSWVEAKQFYVSELDWSPDQFDCVDWSSLRLFQQKKDTMLTLWLSKQASKFCGTRLQVSRMTPSEDDRCPNCLRPEERASHLNLCPHPDRTRQFMESVDELEKWMHNDHTHPELAFWIPRYLRARTRSSFENLAHLVPRASYITMSSNMKAVARAQDKIGWIHFLEGKITGHIKSMQRLHLMQSSSRLNSDDWIKKFIAHLIRISHTQWIFRNLTLHDKQHGHLALLKREELAQEITRLQALDPSDVPPESRFLLDFDISDLAEGDINRQELWISAMRAARIAGVRKQNRKKRWQSSTRRVRRRHDPPTRAFRPSNDDTTLQFDLFGDILPSPSRRRPNEASYFLLEPSNKRRRRRRRLSDDSVG